MLRDTSACNRDEASEELKLIVPTYFGGAHERDLCRDKEEIDEPNASVLFRKEDGVRVVLGTHDYDDMRKPDIQIERRPNGWAIMLHPLGGGDPSGVVYFLDDGRSYLVKEIFHGEPGAIRVVRPNRNLHLVDLEPEADPIVFNSKTSEI